MAPYIVPLILAAVMSIYLLRQFWSHALEVDDVDRADAVTHDADTPRETLKAA